MLVVAGLLANGLMQKEPAVESAYGGSCGVTGFYSSMHDSLDLDRGKKLFKNNCATCHNKDMKSKMTGPALGGVTDRWAAYPKEDLYEWIRSSTKMIGDEHPRAVELWNEWSPVVMSDFPDLSDQDIEEILAYIEIWHIAF